MHNELTRMDIQKMQEELDERRLKLRPQLIEEVKTARAFGDLSENYEYKVAKQLKNRNDSRIRFLENMIKTAVVIDDRSSDDEVGLFDRVTIYMPEDDEEDTVQVVTTLRLDVLDGRISRESPLGKALLGRRVGDRMTVQANDQYSYEVVVRAIEKVEDDGSIPLNSY